MTIETLSASQFSLRTEQISEHRLVSLGISYIAMDPNHASHIYLLHDLQIYGPSSDHYLQDCLVNYTELSGLSTTNAEVIRFITSYDYTFSMEKAVITKITTSRGIHSDS